MGLGDFSIAPELRLPKIRDIRVDVAWRSKNFTKAMCRVRLHNSKHIFFKAQVENDTPQNVLHLPYK